MKLLSSAFFILCWLVLFACRSSETVRDSQTPEVAQTGQGDTLTKVEVPVVKPPATIKPNASFVSAFIDTVIPIDDIHFTIRVHLATALSEGSFESLAEPGQSFELTPMFVKAANDSLIWTDEQNVRYMELRHTGYGDTFIGVISLKPTLGWVIERLDEIIHGQIK